MSSGNAQSEQLAAARAAFASVMPARIPRLRPVFWIGLGSAAMLAVIVASYQRGPAFGVAVNSTVAMLPFASPVVRARFARHFRAVVVPLTHSDHLGLREAIAKRTQGYWRTSAAAVLIAEILVGSFLVAGAITTVALGVFLHWFVGFAAVLLLLQQQRARMINDLQIVGDWLDGRVCYSCSYDLTGNASGTCPECGVATVKTLNSER